MVSQTRRKGQGRAAKEAVASKQRVLLLDDCFNTFNEPEIGKAAVRVLEAAGCAVELAGISCCARPLISKGFLVQARQLIQAQAPAWRPALPMALLFWEWSRAVY